MCLRLWLVLVAIAPLVLSGSSYAGEASQPRENMGKAGWQVKTLIDLPDRPVAINTWLKVQGWESKRHDPSRLEVGHHRLHLVSRDDSIMIGTRRGFPIDPYVWRRLRLRLRVLRTPTGTDNAKRSGDDAAFRLYVAFDRGGSVFHPPRTLVYTWTENVKADTFINSPYFPSVLRYISIGKGPTAPLHGSPGTMDIMSVPALRQEDGWVVVERNVLDDYRRAFPDDTREVPALTGIVLKSDSNDTGTSAEAWLTALELLTLVRDGVSKEP